MLLMLLPHHSARPRGNMISPLSAGDRSTELGPPHNVMQLVDAIDLNRFWRRRLFAGLSTYLKNSIGTANLARDGLEVPITLLPRQSEHRKRSRNPSFAVSHLNPRPQGQMATTDSNFVWCALSSPFIDLLTMKVRSSFSSPGNHCCQKRRTDAFFASPPLCPPVSLLYMRQRRLTLA
jgi:hypothetical protein